MPLVQLLADNGHYVIDAYKDLNFCGSITEDRKKKDELLEKYNKWVENKGELKK